MRLPNTLFISHTSLDDAFIKGADGQSPFGHPGSICLMCSEHFPDPFYHSLRTGAAEAYECVVGLALLAATRVLAIWSKNAWRSDYVRAELLVAIEANRKIAAYIAPDTPAFPLDGVRTVYNHQALDSLLSTW